MSITISSDNNNNNTNNNNNNNNMVFASWRPGKALLGALLFAFFDALQLRLQQASGAAEAAQAWLGFVPPYQLYLALPYAMAIVALVLVARRAAYPQALMKPYRKGER